jgi:flagellar biosynthesis/type III secretory pathway protein FliH
MGLCGGSRESGFVQRYSCLNEQYQEGHKEGQQEGQQEGQKVVTFAVCM